MVFVKIVLFIIFILSLFYIAEMAVVIFMKINGFKVFSDDPFIKWFSKLIKA